MVPQLIIHVNIRKPGASKRPRARARKSKVGVAECWRIAPAANCTRVARCNQGGLAPGAPRTALRYKPS
jgi:hypothetical protein